ncbi:hypothetical protein GCM10009716_31850 [Streptomyces sodiiphilus]|uniref:Uncharacterized protein n=1 Tax=Streptomyces sodiiphilus TaxID=226217 RepID=A0ABP5AT72_9ACTN
MHADLSRATFRPEKRYSAVLAQQGRVQLDADANEQTAIELHRDRTVAADLIGQHGGPVGATGFRITYEAGRRGPDTLHIGEGRYYVDGILCDATRPLPGDPAESGDDGDCPGPEADAAAAVEPPPSWSYWDQPDGHLDPERAGDRLPGEFPYLVCLKVWERTVTAAEDPQLREVALGPAVPDTAARTKVVWQVLPLPGAELELPDGEAPDADTLRAAFRLWSHRRSAPAARLAARSERPAGADDDPCAVPPDARYRGVENQLYRVEVHQGGAGDGNATFKWSRENGSVVFSVAGLDGTWAELESPGGDEKLDLHAGDLVEFGDTASVSRGEAHPLLTVEEVDLPGLRVRLSAEPPPGCGRRPHLRPFLRRWDHRAPSRKGGPASRAGALRIEEGAWTGLEDGVQVWFEKGGDYRTGDYWLIPARTVTGSVEWPADAGRQPLLRPPAGIEVHWAPLAWVQGEGTVTDLRMAFRPLAEPVPAERSEGKKD